jgi:hypothetical protein
MWRLELSGGTQEDFRLRKKTQRLQNSTIELCLMSLKNVLGQSESALKYAPELSELAVMNAVG